MPFTTTRRVLFGECDPAGVIYTPRVADFVVEAVHDFVAYLLGGPAVRELFAMNILPPARALSIEYLAPMVWDDVISIEVSCKETRRTSFSFLLVGRNASGQVTFQSEFTQVCVSPIDKRPTPIPEALGRALRGEERG